MDRKNIRIYGGNGIYFIEDQYQKDKNFDCKDSIVDCNDAIFDCKDTNFDSKYTIFYDEVLTIIMILMLIEYYYLKVAINILLDTNIQTK